MRGSVRKYDGAQGVSWLYVIDAGTGADGKRIQKKRRGFPTRKVAEAAMQLELHQRRSGTYIEKSAETVGELLDRRFTTVAKHKVKPTTLEDYALTIRRHLKPALGAIAVQDLTPATVQRFYADRVDAGVGARTVQLCHLRLSQALALAVREGTLTRNVCAVTEPPPAPHKPGASWTAEEARRFLAAESDTYSPLWLLALSTGLRRGELPGLRCSDLDVERGMLTVRQTVVILAGAPSIQPPQTSAARRAVKLSAEAVAALSVHRVRQVAARLQASSWEDNPHLLHERRPTAQSE